MMAPYGGSMSPFQVKYCRMCALELKQGVFIFGEEGKRLEIPDKIRKTVAILVLEEDSLPKKICTDCCSSLEDYSKYKDTVLDAQEKLTEIARNLERSAEHSSSNNYVNNKSHYQHKQQRKERRVLVERERPSKEVQVHPPSSPDSPLPNHSFANESEEVDERQDRDDEDERGRSDNDVDSRTVVQHSVNNPESDAGGASPTVLEERAPGNSKTPELSELPRVQKSYEQLIIPSPTKNAATAALQNSGSGIRFTTGKDRGNESVFDVNCGLCEFCPEDRKALEAHHRVDHDLQRYPSPVYGCPLCPRITENYNAIRIHIYRHQKEERFKCKECDKTFAFKDQLDKHVLAAHNPSGKAFSCKLCGKRFTAKCSLVAHMTSKHPMSSEDSASSSLATIDALDKVQPVQEEVGRSADSPGGVDFHHDMTDTAGESEETQRVPEKSSEPSEKQKHDSSGGLRKCSADAKSDSGVWKCEYCDKLFQTETGYRSHVASHRGMRFPCEQCDAVFSQKGSLTHHVATKHPTADAEHQCGICRKKFLLKKLLKAHERYHAVSSSPFVCSLCNKQYKTQNHLRIHMRYHRDNKKFVCSTCGKAFRNRIKLSHHENTHTGNKSFKCSSCDFATTSSGAYYRHLKKSHSKQETPNQSGKAAGEFSKTRDASIISGVSGKTSTIISPSAPTIVNSSQNQSNSQENQAQPSAFNTNNTTSVPQQTSTHLAPSHTSPATVTAHSSQIYAPHSSVETAQNNCVSSGGINYSQPQTQLSNPNNHLQANHYQHQQATHLQQTWPNPVPVSSHNHGQLTTGGNGKSYQNPPMSSVVSQSQHSNGLGGLHTMELVDCAIHHSLTVDEISSPAHNLSYSHPHDYSPNHNQNSHQTNAGNIHHHLSSSHGANIATQVMGSSSSGVCNAHSANTSSLSASSSSLIISSTHNSIHNSSSSRCHQSEPMELSYKLPVQIDNSGFQDMPMELTKVFQRDPLELCVRQDFNPLMDLSSRVSDGNGMNLNSIHMNSGMNGSGGSGNGMGMSAYHKLDMMERDLSFSDLSGAFRQPIDLIARVEDTHELCSEGSLVDLSLRSSFVQDQSASSFLRELIDLSARSDSFHGELNLTNKQQQNNHSAGSGAPAQSHHHNNIHQHGTGNQHHTHHNATNSSSTAGNKPSTAGGNGQTHHGNGASSFQNLYHDSIFNMQN